MKRILDAIEKANSDATAMVERDLRKHALKHGWDKKVVDGLKVEHTGDSYKIHVDAEHGDQAFVHEYGNENTRPTAAIRKYENSRSAEHIFLQSLKKQMKGWQ